MNYLTTGDSNKRHGVATSKLTGGIQVGSKGRKRYQPIVTANVSESLALECGLRHVSTATKDLSQTKYWHKQDDWLGHHELKTYDCKPHGRAGLLGSLTLLLSAWTLLPNKTFCFVSTCVFSDNSFLRVDKSRFSGSERGPCSSNNSMTMDRQRPTPNKRAYNRH